MRRVLAASLFLSPLVHAADAAAPKQAAPPLMLQAFSAAAHELQKAVEDGADLDKTFAARLNFQHSPETARLLADSFGDERPWSMERRGSGTDGRAYRWLLKPLHRTTPAGTTVVWSEFPIDFDIDKGGQSLAYRGAWPSASFEDKDARMTMSDFTLGGKQRRGAGDIWYGDVRGSLDTMQIDGKRSPFTVVVRGMDFTSKVLERPRTVDMLQTFGIKSIEFAGDRVDDFKLAVRIVNADKATLVAIRAAEKKMTPTQVANRGDLAALMPLLKTLVSGAAARKTELRFDEMSIRFHGHQAMLRGRIGLDPVPGNKVADLPGIVKYINARFTVRVPLALVREVALAMVRKQAAAANMALPQDTAALAASAADAIVGKLVGTGYARLEDDALVSTIAFRGGVLRVNGKKVDLPKPAGGPVPAPAPAGAANFMQARRIGDSCTLPDYPEEVVTNDRALALTLQYVVDPEGKLRGLQLAQPSGFPDYDGELVRAFEGCRFIPALQDGKPVAQTMTYTLSREPGSVRP